jgi:hypothetical protein
VNPPHCRGGPTLVGNIGPQACGKATLAVALAAALRAPVVQPHQAIRRYLAQHPPLTPQFPAVIELAILVGPGTGPVFTALGGRKVSTHTW